MTPWYLTHADELPSRLTCTVDALVDRDGPRLAAYIRYGQLYGGRRRTQAAQRRDRIHGRMRPDAALTTTRVGASSEDDEYSEAPLRLNVVKAAIDTVTSKVGALRPRPTFLTTRGDWTLQQRAKNLQRFVDGAYHQTDSYELAMDVFRDAMVYGTGVLLPYRRGAEVKRPRLCAERVPAWEFFVDEDDAEYGNPRCLYRERWVSRERVRQVWGEDALPHRGVDQYVQDSGDDLREPELVRVLEAWYRPGDPTEVMPDDTVAVDMVPREGRHVVVIDAPPESADGMTYDAKLVVDEYFPYPEFPPLFFHWSTPTTGFWGDCAVREVEGLQVEINRLLQSVQKSMRLVGVPLVFTHADANLKPSKLTNQPGEHYTYEGQIKPEVVTFNAISPQIVNHLWELYAKAFEILGSNQLAASATAPAGLESGRALERLSEEHSERFKMVSRAFNFAMGQGLARKFLLLAKLLNEETPGGYKLRAPQSRHSLELKWSEVEILPDNYVLQVFDTSVLPTLPSARVQEVERMQMAGWLEPDEARRLLDFPDLQESNSFATADFDNLMWQFEEMLERGRDVLPEPFQSLERAIKLGQAAILRAQRDGVPESNVDKLRTFVAVAVTMAQPPAPAAAPPGAAPPGAPGPGPNSDMDQRNDVMTTAAPPDQLPVAGGMPPV